MAGFIFADTFVVIHVETLFALQLRHDSHGQDTIYCARYPTVIYGKPTMYFTIEEIDTERERESETELNKRAD